MQIDNRVFVYQIDGKDRIIHVNDEWLDFATENDGEALTYDAVQGRSLYSYIDNQEVQQLWSRLIDKVRSLGSAINIPFRCDSPDKRRYMRMEVYPLSENKVEFKVSIYKVEVRDPIQALGYGIENPSGFCVMCSWCKKIHLGHGRWVEVEEAISELDLFGDGKNVSVRNSVCPSCFKELTETI